MGDNKYDIFKAWASMGGSVDEFTTTLNNWNCVVNNIQRSSEETDKALKEMSDRLSENEANYWYTITKADVDATTYTREIDDIKLDIEQLRKDIAELKVLFNDIRPESSAEIVNPIQKVDLDFSDLYEDYYNFVKNPFID